MANGEIKINQEMLDLAISNLVYLQAGTGYKPTLVVAKSKGSTSDAINAMYSELVLVEDELLRLVGITKEVLTKAGISFEEAEETAKNKINAIIGSVGGGSRRR